MAKRPDKHVRMFLLVGDKGGFPVGTPQAFATAVGAAMGNFFAKWKPADFEPGPGMGLTDEQLEECRKLGVRFAFDVFDAPAIKIPQCPDCNASLGGSPTTVVCPGCGRAEAGRSLKDALGKFKDGSE